MTAPSPIHHALVLNLHQPPGNLDLLWESEPWAAKEILFAIDRMPRALWDFEDIARVHLSMSGTLLESLGSPAFQSKVYGAVKTGDLLWHLQNKKVFNILGTGYYHPVLPLIPENDWDEQIQRWIGIGSHLFWRENFPGFWPPEMGFRMEMIPHLAKAGYRYVLVDEPYVEPVDGEMSWQELRYRPHIAEYSGAEITIVVRDRDLSNAQLSGMDPAWFINELEERTKYCDFPPLVTTCSDGDNGGWFRNHNEQANFWHVLYRPLLEQVREGTTRVRPAFIEDYLDEHGAHGRVTVKTGAWNTEDHFGDDFTQWTGTQEQKDALKRVADMSERFHNVCKDTGGEGAEVDGRLRHLLHEAHWRLLRAETSCNFYWAQAWTPKVHEDLDGAGTYLDQIDRVAG